MGSVSIDGCFSGNPVEKDAGMRYERPLESNYKVENPESFLNVKWEISDYQTFVTKGRDGVAIPQEGSRAWRKCGFCRPGEATVKSACINTRVLLLRLFNKNRF